MFAWGLIAFLLVVLVYQVTTARPESEEPAMANVGSSPRGAGSPPDISQMTPRERFLRLSDRVLSAADRGDTATVTRFSPMAFAAYGMLDSVDAEARYRVALLDLKLGRPGDALALADTIFAGVPHHLLGYLIQIAAAEASGDRAVRDRARAGFLAAYDVEIRVDRPEYQDHKNVLEQARRSFVEDQTRKVQSPAAGGTAPR